MEKHFTELLELLQRRKKIRKKLAQLKKRSSATGLELLQEAVALPDNVLLAYNEMLAILQLAKEDYSYLHFLVYVRNGRIIDHFKRDYRLVEIGERAEKLSDLCKDGLKF